MKQIVGEVTAAIETDLKPGLKSTAEHKGFCTALSAVNDRLGKDSVVGGLEDPGAPVCPDCGAVVVKLLDWDGIGEERLVPWACDCVEGGGTRKQTARGVIGRFDTAVEPPGEGE